MLSQLAAAAFSCPRVPGACFFRDTVFEVLNQLVERLRDVAELVYPERRSRRSLL
jgi:hypothetical protein